MAAAFRLARLFFMLIKSACRTPSLCSWSSKRDISWSRVAAVESTLDTPLEGTVEVAADGVRDTAGTGACVAGCGNVATLRVLIGTFAAVFSGVRDTSQFSATFIS
eukprot:CAMPEP_0194494914 /NCGR_PEP_ID=MMETSP0253-20130528/12677_1 /TAXON_ID=2966 /ORGANISM="Noctiluca scintillans" /LENGTH=105 /DNA_ID=CAMNT_0039336099 /DNA_START=253 /DNA_END=570 /DNA_ORIENTATION=+